MAHPSGPESLVEGVGGGFTWGAALMQFEPEVQRSAGSDPEISTVRLL